jgi:integrase
VPRQRRATGTLFLRGSSKIWTMAYRDHTGRRVVRSTRTTDKRAAERVLAKAVADTALRREGVIDATADGLAAASRVDLTDHVEEYMAHCERSALSKRNCHQKRAHLRQLCEAANASRLTDLTPERLEAFLHSLTERGKSARTRNHYRQDIVAFANWCVSTGRLAENSLKRVKKLDESTDRRRVRRPLTEDELARLFDVARNRGRLAWYMAAALAGLRKGDLKRLRWSDIDFDASTIRIVGGKAKRTDFIPMHPQLRDELRRVRPSGMHPAALASSRVFSTAVTDRTRQADFERAGIASKDAEGRVADLHAMRTTLATRLAKQGTTPQIAQKILRHADFRTTMSAYTVLQLADTAQAIEGLPEIGLTSLAATGTDDEKADSNCERRCERNERAPVHSDASSRRGGPIAESTSTDDKPLRLKSQCASEHPDAPEGGKAGDGTRTRNFQLGKLTLYH